MYVCLFVCINVSKQWVNSRHKNGLTTTRTKEKLLKRDVYYVCTYIHMKDQANSWQNR